MTTLQIDMPPELVERLSRIEAQLDRLSEKMAPEPEFYTTQEVAAIRKCSAYTVRKMVREGRLPCIRDGNKMLFKPSDINPEG